MIEVPQRQSNKLSRRHILIRGVACAAGAAAVLGPVTRARAAKMPPTSPAVAYQDTPKGAQQCSNCLLFQAPSSCQIVDGTISASGWCKLWAKK